MLLLSLGAETISALLWHGAPPRLAGQDLAWMLVAPDMAPAGSETGGNGADIRYRASKNILLINDLTG